MPALNFSDPHVRRVAHFALGTMALILLSVSSFSCAFVYEYLVHNDSMGNNANGLAAVVKNFPRPEDAKLQEFAGLLAILIAAVPLAVTPICFYAPDAEGKRNLSPFGAGLLYTLLGTLLLAILAYLSLSPEAWSRAQAHSLALTDLSFLQDGIKSVIRLCVFFLASLLGLKAVQ